MRMLLFGLFVVAVLSTPLLDGRGQSPPSSPAEKNQASSIDQLMQRKQKLAHEILDALILKDFKRISKNANTLVSLSKAAEFQVHRTPLYAQYTAEFQEAAKKLGENARALSSDGTTRAFFETVHSCCRCHDYIREKHGK